MNSRLINKKVTPETGNIKFLDKASVEQYIVGATQLYYTFESKNKQVNKKTPVQIADNYKVNISINNILNFIDDNIGMNINSYVGTRRFTSAGLNRNNTLHLKGNYDYSNGCRGRVVLLQNDMDENLNHLQNFKLVSANNHYIKRVSCQLPVLIEQNGLKKYNEACEIFKDFNSHSNSLKLQSGYRATFYCGRETGFVSVEQTYCERVDGGLQTIDFSNFLGNKALTGAVVFVKSFDVLLTAGQQLKWIRVGTDAVKFCDQKITFMPQVQTHESNEHIESIKIKLVVIGSYDLAPQS